VTRPHKLFVGTIGEGVFRSTDGGATFRRACDGMFVECDVRALVVHPRDPDTLYLGNELGVFVSRDGADNWTRLPAPVDGLEVWSLWVSARHPEVLLAGTRPSRVFRSEDGGRTWVEAATRMNPDCPRILHTRVTTICGDPGDPTRLWAGVEIDGVHRSTDGGRSWEPLGTGLSSQDIHAIVVVPAGDGVSSRRLLAATNNDLNRSADDGATWQPLGVGRSLPWSYCRALAQRPGRPAEVLLGNGDGPPGSCGVVARSRDGGDTWDVAGMPGRANSTLWCFATHPADPDLVYAASVSGGVYRSGDGGASWEKLAREFGEVRALAWSPA
jgi:photosystem II stability/assembly factor-like uncharacterized protein